MIAAHCATRRALPCHRIVAVMCTGCPFSTVEAQNECLQRGQRDDLPLSDRPTCHLFDRVRHPDSGCGRLGRDRAAAGGHAGTVRPVRCRPWVLAGAPGWMRAMLLETVTPPGLRTSLSSSCKGPQRCYWKRLLPHRGPRWQIPCAKEMTAPIFARRAQRRQRWSPLGGAYRCASPPAGNAPLPPQNKSGNLTS